MEIKKARHLQVGKYDEEFVSTPFLERKWVSVDSLLIHLTEILDYDDKFHCVHDFNEDKIIELMKLLSSNSKGFINEPSFNSD